MVSFPVTLRFYSTRLFDLPKEDLKTFLIVKCDVVSNDQQQFKKQSVNKVTCSSGESLVCACRQRLAFVTELPLLETAEVYRERGSEKHTCSPICKHLYCVGYFLWDVSSLYKIGFILNFCFHVYTGWAVVHACGCRRARLPSGCHPAWVPETKLRSSAEAVRSLSCRAFSSIT